MKKSKMMILAMTVILGVSVFSGCGARVEDPGEPPAEVISGKSADAEKDAVQDEDSADREKTNNGDEILADAVSVRIGRDGTDEWNIDMYHNVEALTMLDYLSDSALLFPTYTYE